MADNITDLSGLVGMTFRAGWEAAYINVEQINNNSDGTYSISSFSVYDYSDRPTAWSDFTLDIQNVGASSLEIYIPEFDMTVTGEVLAHTQETLFVYIADLDEYRLLLTDNWRNDPDYDLVQSTVNGGAGFTLYQGGITVSETHPQTPFDLPCFAEGTLIATPNGMVAVEDLCEGDSVVTATGVARAIKWIGSSAVQPGWLSLRGVDVHPVRVKADAFGAGLPVRDLRLSPGHAVFVDGVLVPVGLLVNGATILREEVKAIRYYHVELDSHDVLLAEGMPCESYLDDGNRDGFANADVADRLDPKSWDEACAPMVADGPQLAAIRQRLHAEAEAQGWTRCEEPDLAIKADGVTILPEMRIGNRYRFSVPAAGQLSLVSNRGILAHVMPELADHRTLGVAVSALVVNGVAADLDGPVFGKGFHAVERQQSLAWRWTDGSATLDLGGIEAAIEIEIAMVAPNWKRALPARTLIAA